MATIAQQDNLIVEPSSFSRLWKEDVSLIRQLWELAERHTALDVVVQALISGAGSNSLVLARLLAFSVKEGELPTFMFANNLAKINVCHYRAFSALQKIQDQKDEIRGGKTSGFPFISGKKSGFLYDNAGGFIIASPDGYAYEYTPNTTEGTIASITKSTTTAEDAKTSTSATGIVILSEDDVQLLVGNPYSSAQ